MTQAEFDDLRAMLDRVNTTALRDMPVTFAQLRAVVEATRSPSGASPAAPGDTERLDWLTRQASEGDGVHLAVSSMADDDAEVQFSRGTRYRTAKGTSLRDAIDAALSPSGSAR